MAKEKCDSVLYCGKSLSWYVQNRGISHFPRKITKFAIYYKEQNFTKFFFLTKIANFLSNSWEFWTTHHVLFHYFAAFINCSIDELLQNPTSWYWNQIQFYKSRPDSIKNLTKCYDLIKPNDMKSDQMFPKLIRCYKSRPNGNLQTCSYKWYNRQEV